MICSRGMFHMTTQGVPPPDWRPPPEVWSPEVKLLGIATLKATWKISKKNTAKPCETNTGDKSWFGIFGTWLSLIFLIRKLDMEMHGNVALVVNWGLAGIDVACFGVFRGVTCQEMLHVTSDGLTRDPKNVTQSFKTEKSLGYDLLPWDQPRDGFSS